MTVRTVLGMLKGLALASSLALIVLSAGLLWRELLSPRDVVLSTTGALPVPTLASTSIEAGHVPAVQFRDAQGRNLSLSDFRGKVLLLNVWATWCIPCRRELPALDRLQSKLGSDQFDVLALSVDQQGLGAAKPFWEQSGLKALHLYLDPSGKATQALRILGLPTTLLIDLSGRERGRMVGAAAWDSDEAIQMIRHYLSERAAAAGDASHG